MAIKGSENNEQKNKRQREWLGSKRLMAREYRARIRAKSKSLKRLEGTDHKSGEQRARSQR